MSEKEVSKDYLTLFTVPAFIENIHASALGTGVKATTMIDRERRIIKEGEPLNMWATLGVVPDGQIVTDMELLERQFAKKDVILVFRRPKCPGNPIPKTLGLARMLGPRNSPYTRPFPGWPRTVSTGTKDAGWMKTIPFPIEWYFTCNIDDKELALPNTNMPAKFTECALGTEFELLTRLYKASKIRDPTKMHMINADAFGKLAEKYRFKDQGMWTGKVHQIPKPKKEAPVIVID